MELLALNRAMPFSQSTSHALKLPFGTPLSLFLDIFWTADTDSKTLSFAFLR